jgi:hypothetical protein
MWWITHTFMPLEYALTCAALDSPFQDLSIDIWWQYINTHLVILFCQNISKTIYFTVSRNLEKHDSWENTRFIYNRWCSIECTTPIFFILTFTFFDFLLQTVQYERNSPICVNLSSIVMKKSYFISLDIIYQEVKLGSKIIFILHWFNCLFRLQKKIHDFHWHI